jgi:hypothetical protein
MTQDYKNIEELINRFFDGQSSNKEERELYAFFSGENIPEHLLSFKPVFAYFETGINEEFKQPKIMQVSKYQLNNRKILLWVGGIAASLLLLLSIRFFYAFDTQNLDPYEGSYIIRNGIKITDPEIVRPEIEKTLEMAMRQQAEYEQLIEETIESEAIYLQMLEEEIDLLNQYSGNESEI